MTTTSYHCVKCGGAFETSGLGGNCPACLAKVILGGELDHVLPPVQRLGDYDLISEEGRGGMGVI